PCAEASKASMDCLNRNNYDRDACLDFFQAYRDCKNAWIQRRNEDRRAGRPTV
ncbi:cysteine alpha-hairpin motif superfamily, partial [Cyathus striatus]